MKIAYGVLGYGQGHATRALSVLPLLARQHEVRILASGDALQALSPKYAVHPLPSLRYEYDGRGKRCLWRTTLRQWPTAVDAVLGGAELTRVMRVLLEFAPDVAICDCDPFVHHACARLGIPRVSFDHFGVLAFCRVPMPWSDRLAAVRDVAMYRSFIGNPQRVVVSSFFDAPTLRSDVQLVPALVREEVRTARALPGEHLLVYLNNGKHQLTPRIEGVLHDLRMPVIVYGTERRGDDGRLAFRAPSGQRFVEDLARAIAVFSTAGNQLVAEALHLGKPMLVMAENTVEQRTNARALERIGFGRAVAHESITVRAIHGVLADVARYRINARHQARDGTQQAAAVLLRCATDLARAGRVSRAAWRPVIVS